MNLLFFILAFALSASVVKAHCPLCTLGAAAAAGGAAMLGVNNAVIGLFVGAFAISTGLWFSRLIKKKFFKYQDQIVVVVSYLTTIMPMLPFLSSYVPIYFSGVGVYGTTIAFNLTILTSLMGGGIVFLAPSLSRKVSQLRNNKMIPYQGIMITLLTLSLTGTILQVILWM